MRIIVRQSLASPTLLHNRPYGGFCPVPLDAPFKFRNFLTGKVFDFNIGAGNLFRQWNSNGVANSCQKVCGRQYFSSSRTDHFYRSIKLCRPIASVSTSSISTLVAMSSLMSTALVLMVGRIWPCVNTSGLSSTSRIWEMALSCKLYFY